MNCIPIRIPTDGESLPERYPKASTPFSFEKHELAVANAFSQNALAHAQSTSTVRPSK